MSALVELSKARGYAVSSPVLRAITAEMTGGLLLRAGLPGADLEPAERRYGASGATLRAIACEILDLLGRPDPQNTYDRLRAAFSTSIGADVLTNAVNTAFMTAFRSSDDTATGWTIERELTNFKQNRRLRVGFPEELTPIPRGESPPHVTLDLEAGAETYHAIRYGRQFQVDEQDLVSDDLDAVLQPFIVLGRGANRLKLDLVYSELMSNPTLADGVALFHSSHANLSTSAALATDKLDAAMAAVRGQTENNAPVNAVPRYLLVPPALEGLGGRLVRIMTAAGVAGLTTRAEPRLTLGVTDPRSGSAHSGSATTWYLAAGGFPTIEFGFRTREPVISAWQPGQGRWGLGFGLTWDVGAKTLAYHGLHRATA